MRSKILVRILIVLLAAFLVFRIHQRVETYRVPRDLCRTQIGVLADANIQHMFEHDGVPAPDLDSLLAYAEGNGHFSTAMNTDTITVSIPDEFRRSVLIPDEWKNLWNATAIAELESDLASLHDQHEGIESQIRAAESELGFTLDSLISLREVYVLENPEDEEDEDAMTPGEYFDDSLGFSAEELLEAESDLAASTDSLISILQDFSDVVAPARKDSVSRVVIAVCPTLWEGGYHDSLYSYDPKLALGSQFAISCPNMDRHGGVVGGFIEEDYPDTMFMEPDWSETQMVYRFPEYAVMRRVQASRSNLIRVAEEQAAYISQRYPRVITPRRLENLEVNIDRLTDPLGGEYVFQIQPDTTYVFYENPEGRTAMARGDSVTVETMKFVGYTTADPDTMRVEVFLSHPLTFPSRTEGAEAGDNDNISVIKYWERSESGTLKVDEREVDLLDEPTWDFVSTHFGSEDTTETE